MKKTTLSILGLLSLVFSLGCVGTAGVAVSPPNARAAMSPNGRCDAAARLEDTAACLRMQIRRMNEMLGKQAAAPLAAPIAAPDVLPLAPQPGVSNPFGLVGHSAKQSNGSVEFFFFPISTGGICTTPEQLTLQVTNETEESAGLVIEVEQNGSVFPSNCDVDRLRSIVVFRPNGLQDVAWVVPAGTTVRYVASMYKRHGSGVERVLGMKSIVARMFQTLGSEPAAPIRSWKGDIKLPTDDGTTYVKRFRIENMRSL